MTTPLDILRRTPKNNCGQCGFPTCLAFSAAVATSNANPGKCPFLETEGLKLEQKEETSRSPAEEKDLALVQHLKSKIAVLDFASIASPLGATLLDQGDPVLSFDFLGQKVRVSKTSILIDNLEPHDPRDQILLYNYIHSCGGNQPLRNWVGLESLPNSISKVRTLAVYCEDRLATLFDQSPVEAILEAASQLTAENVTESSASLALIIPALPMIPMQLLFWQAEPEDGFDAKVKVLFDEKVMDFLDIESLVFTAERMAERFADLLQN